MSEKVLEVIVAIAGVALIVVFLEAIWILWKEIKELKELTGSKRMSCQTVKNGVVSGRTKITLLFKAKREDNNEWVEGYYWTNLVHNHFIRVAKDNKEKFAIEDFEILPETLCQYTGMTDYKGTRIFENDIIEFEDLGEDGYEYKEGFEYTNRAVVEWDKMMYTLNKFQYSGNSGVQELLFNNENEEIHCTFTGSKVIGNVFDNPELLEVEE